MAQEEVAPPQAASTSNISSVIVPVAAPVADVSLTDITASPATKAELEKFYAARNNHPAWNLADEDGVKKAVSFIDSLAALIAYHGLEEATYPLEQMRGLANSTESADKQKLEPMITACLFHLAHDLHGDAVDLDAIYPGWNFHRDTIDLPVLMGQAVRESTLGSFFDQIAPQNAAYRGLAIGLKNYREIAAKGAWPVIDNGGNLRPGDHDPRMPQLRARLAAEGYIESSANNSELFGDSLSKALLAYQERNGLTPDGHLGGKTVDSLNVPVAERINQIRATMERWRHMPDSFPPANYTVVNIPAFTVDITEDNKVIYSGIVVDGQPERPTPFVGSRITNMVVNPSWHVPVKLAKKDILPKLVKNPRYLEKMGMVIEGRTDDPAGTTINWKKLDPDHFPYTLRQAPGDLNSLGQLKFNFKNPFDVYMHGTPHQELFDKAERDFSSGCVRLEDPEGVAQILLQHTHDKNGDWDEARIGHEIEAGETKTVLLAKPMPIYFLYWDAFPDDGGAVNFRKDIYGYDPMLINKVKEKNAL